MSIKINPMQSVSKDEEFRAEIANNAMKKSKGLASIIGVEEFKDVIEKHSDDPEIFSVGDKVFEKSGKIIGFSNKNINSALGAAKMKN